MKKIIISPFSRPLRNGLPNAKDYPYWEDVIKILHENNIHTTQIGVDKERQLSTNEYKFNCTFEELEKLVLSSDTWVSVDNFFPHFCNTINKRGIVIFGKSDPNIFGYKENINLLRDRKYLRPDQYNVWEGVECDSECFINPKTIITTIQGVLNVN